MNISNYIAGHQSLIDGEEKRRQAFFEEALGKAREIARILTLNYPGVNVRLFGSLATELYQGDSDIDLAVKGLRDEDVSAAIKTAEAIADPIPVDLVQVEYAPEGLLRAIEQEGVLL